MTGEDRHGPGGGQAERTARAKTTDESRLGAGSQGAALMHDRALLRTGLAVLALLVVTGCWGQVESWDAETGAQGPQEVEAGGEAGKTGQVGQVCQADWSDDPDGCAGWVDVGAGRVARLEVGVCVWATGADGEAVESWHGPAVVTLPWGWELWGWACE